MIYVTNTSLDGYIEDEKGNFDWVNPEPVFGFITELIQPIGTYLCGRRLYQTMEYWDGPVENYLPEQRDFARTWQKAQMIIFSRTLTDVARPNTRLARDFDPQAVRKLKRDAEHDISVGGAELAGLALEADLVDECHLFVNPVVVGGGKPAFPASLHRKLELLETRPFDNGAVYVRYRVKGSVTGEA